MPSWRYNPHEPVSYEDEFRDSPYEAAIRAKVREDMRTGVGAPMGYRRPVDPPCPAHGYSLVEGKCGMCLLGDAEGAAELGESAAARRAA